MIYPVDAVLKAPAQSKLMALPLLYLLQSLDKTFLDRVLAVLGHTDGRDKTVKIVQYFCKLALALNQAKYKPLIGTLAKQLSGARRVMRLGKSLKVVNNSLDALAEPAGWQRTAAMLSVCAGTVGDVGDDLCWASDMALAPSWIGAYDVWVDRLWFFTLCCDLPLNTCAILDARAALVACDPEADPVAYHNCQVKLASVTIAQIKAVADFFHATRLAFNWPTGSTGQDAVCGLVSASCSLVKMWKPAFLTKAP
ncbi:hypothetical protein SDRG_16831 [Saprolegnia diclina VS20]|uniref:Uncharacterized protein n=1 Tax=Saprolegnia diclina (strain VS20) TaxID=1156394 RepID=T0PIV6_SAPDV|nr:hypothetical protein SDRG_16831 [Saprolegnia diclina VS20]EQC25309.1 hypothetical protein SDRG_16831 [Saprolegnia diclina VS20]|eukprot:XP_008621275.1 hypothetical protein SDRG_16831 [Saprolegnia diclina VS20]